MNIITLSRNVLKVYFSTQYSITITESERVEVFVLIYVKTIKFTLLGHDTQLNRGV